MVEVEGVVDDLVQKLFDPEIGDPCEQRAGDALEYDLPVFLRGCEVPDVPLEELLHIYDLEFLGLEGLLEVRGIGQILHDGSDQHDAAFGACKILARG